VPNAHNPNYLPIIPIGESFGFVIYYDYPKFRNKK